jgi:hypothetical protein
MNTRLALSTALAAGMGLALGSSSAAAPITLAEFNFQDSDRIADTTAPGVFNTPTFVDGTGFAQSPSTFGSIDGSIGIRIDQTDDVYEDNVGPNLSGNPDVNVQTTNGYYYEFALVADPGQVLNLDSFAFEATRSGSGLAGAALYTDVDNFASKVVNIGNFGQANWAPGSTDVSTDAAYQGLSSITVRIAYGGTGNPDFSGSNRFLYVDDVVVTGEVVPEPASLALLAAGGLCLLPRRRR